MIGSIITFLGVCGIVAIYMAIVHSFLRESERSTEPTTSPLPDRQTPPQARAEESRRVRWAH